MSVHHRPRPKHALLARLLLAMIALYATAAIASAATTNAQALPSGTHFATRCGPFDWNDPNWPFCIAGMSQPEPPPISVPPLPPIVIPPLVIPTIPPIPTQSITPGSRALQCERLDDGLQRCTSDGASVTGPENMICTSPQAGTLICSSGSGSPPPTPRSGHRF